MMLFKKKHLQETAFSELKALSAMITPEMFEDGDVYSGDFKFSESGTSLYPEVERQIFKCSLVVLEHIQHLLESKTFQDGICGVIFEVLRDLADDSDDTWVDSSCPCLDNDYSYTEISGAISEIIVDSTKLIWPDWEHFSGSISYPVPAPVGDCSPMRYFHHISLSLEDKWKGAYGEKRKELLSFLIKSFKEKIA